MVTFRILLTSTMLLIALVAERRASAQQAAPTFEQAKKEGEVVWYGTLTGGSIVGNIITSWSWFGVNMLGIGLHSYGFMDAAFMWLMLFVGSQLLLIAIGSLPLSIWRSFRDSAPRSDPKSPDDGKPVPA